jgi:steroid delta-isomerase-like uncharacterized protein
MDGDLGQWVMQVVAAWNTRDIEHAARFYADDYHGVDVGLSKPQQGSRERIAVLRAYIRAFPDLHFTGEPVVQHNRVALFWTMHGTHQGPFMRIPPTGRQVNVRGVSLLTISDAKITHGLHIWDTAGLLRQLGLLPEL